VTEHTSNISNSTKNNKNIKTFINKKMTTKELKEIEISETINKLTMEYRLKGLNKSVTLKVVGEVMKNKDKIENFGGYLRSCLETAWYRVQVKLGYIDPAEKMKALMENSDIPYYNWLEE
jgi:hypothetical protein